MSEATGWRFDAIQPAARSIPIGAPRAKVSPAATRMRSSTPSAGAATSMLV